VTRNHVDRGFDPARPDEDVATLTGYAAAGRVMRTIANYVDERFTPGQPDTDRVTVSQSDPRGRTTRVTRNDVDGTSSPYGRCASGPCRPSGSPASCRTRPGWCICTQGGSLPARGVLGSRIRGRGMPRRRIVYTRTSMRWGIRSGSRTRAGWTRGGGMITPPRARTNWSAGRAVRHGTRSASNASACPRRRGWAGRFHQRGGAASPARGCRTATVTTSSQSRSRSARRNASAGALRRLFPGAGHRTRASPPDAAIQNRTACRDSWCPVGRSTEPTCIPRVRRCLRSCLKRGSVQGFAPHEPFSARAGRRSCPARAEK
jgi:hypothetical protein